MGLNNLGLGFIFTARDLASARIDRLERSFSGLDERVGLGTERINGAFRELGMGLAVFTAGAATVAGAFALADAAGRFEQSIAAVAAVSGATAQELDQLRNAAIEAGIATQFSPTEATVGLRELAQAGFNAQESIQLLIPVLDLAAGSLGDLTPQAAAGLAAQAMKAFGISADEAGVSVDRMLQAVNVFALNASELPLALGTASRGAQTLRQSLSETLIALGLVKNVIPSVERSSTAVAVAMERMADPQVQQQLRGIGVAVVDSQGSFRSFLDVLGEMGPALERMTDAQRSAFLLQTFGREALGGVNAILTQMTTGIRTNTGETVRGAEALRFLRQQFEQAGGTAGQFRDKMLDTFAGQKQLLRGSLETLAIVMGEPFAQVLKPVVGALVDALNGFLKFVRSIPAPVKKAFAGFITAAGAVVAVIGAVIAAKASISLLVIGLKALGITLGGVLSTMLPAVLIVGALASVVGGLYVAFRRNLGGIADFAQRVWDQLSLFFRGLRQLVEQGGFSGAVRDELNRVENQGLKQFLVTVWQVVYRIQRIWEGFRDGFVAAIDAARPVFEDLVDAFRELGREIGGIFAGLGEGAAALPSEEFRSFGEIAGGAVGTVVTWLVQLIAIFTRITSGIIAGFRSMMEYIRPALAAIAGAIDTLKAAWNRLTGATDESTGAVSDSTSAWRALGEFLGKVLGGIVTFIALAVAGLVEVVAAAVDVVTALKDAFITAGTWIGETAAKIYLWFTETLPNAISSAVETIAGFFGAVGAFFAAIGKWFTGIFEAIVDGIKEFARKVVEFFDGILKAIQRAHEALVDFVADSFFPDSPVEQLRQRGDVRVFDSQAELEAYQRSMESSSRATAATSATPAAAEAGARSEDLSKLQASLTAFAQSQPRRPDPPPFTINVQVDGETIARATHQANSDASARSFSPVPAY